MMYIYVLLHREYLHARHKGIGSYAKSIVTIDDNIIHMYECLSDNVNRKVFLQIPSTHTYIPARVEEEGQR